VKFVSSTLIAFGCIAAFISANLSLAQEQQTGTPPATAAQDTKVKLYVPITDGPLARAASVAYEKGENEVIGSYLAGLLGVASDKDFPVRQWLLIGEEKRRSISVSTDRGHIDIVFASMDVGMTKVVLYLTSPKGVLEKAVYAEKGKGGHQVPSFTVQDQFEKEKEFWIQYANNNAK
jgi:hypothetical protein